MFDRFTDRARMVMSLARDESLRRQHDYIGTEHILIGLLAEGNGIACDLLKKLAVDPRQLSDAVRRRMMPGPDPVTLAQLPFTPRAKKSLEFALEESRRFGHDYIGTEHLLLGLLREQNGIAGQALAASGVTADAARHALVAIFGELGPRLVPAADAPPEPFDLPRLRAELAELRRRVEEMERQFRKGGSG